ncbi:hypothetical protein L6164_000918 [Bauhinia variegata]|uniref:Uncharacterized protein n=1 Tax=Bauhinia variegata TaxID=167791 RepID=A0ACB9Q7Z4_BAUVA|nr:hypothetical protein L6164_000918 [Bauhinia variegata]
MKPTNCFLFFGVKREAEDELEKLESAKKQKRDEHADRQLNAKKPVVKVPFPSKKQSGPAKKSKPASSSSSDSSDDSSEDEMSSKIQEKIRSVLIVCMVLHLLIANSEASTLGCYTVCVAHLSYWFLAQCQKSGDNGKIVNHYFCKIGCSPSSCTNQPNMDAGKFDSCDGICAKKERP